MQGRARVTLIPPPRLPCQVSLRKVWQHCEEQQVEDVLQEFRAVPLCLLQHGNAARNAANMLNDFYFKVFHPVRHYTLQVRACVHLIIMVDTLDAGAHLFCL